MSIECCCLMIGCLRDHFHSQWFMRRSSPLWLILMYSDWLNCKLDARIQITKEGLKADFFFYFTLSPCNSSTCPVFPLTPPALLSLLILCIFLHLCRTWTRKESHEMESTWCALLKVSDTVSFLKSRSACTHHYVIEARCEHSSVA